MAEVALATGGSLTQQQAPAKKLTFKEVVVSPPETHPELANAYRDALDAKEWAAMQSWLTTFYPFQLRWLLTPHRRAAAVKSRQIGWSHTTAANGVIWGAYHGELTTIVSKGQVESSEVLEKAVRHAEVLVALGSQMAKPVKSNATELHFASGGRIIALPSSGGRGFTGNVILDEFAYQQDQQAVWDAVVPVTMLGEFRVRVLSTPNGTGDEFEKLITAIRKKTIKRWGLDSISIDEAIAQGYPVDIEECWSMAKGDARIFDQLFRCKFLDNDLQYLPSEAIKLCRKLRVELSRARWYAGLDVGKTSDRSVMVVIGVDSASHKKLAWIQSCKRTDFTQLHGMVATAFRMFPLTRLCVDSTGIGSFEADRIVAKYGAARVEPIVFGAAVKEDMATAMYSNITNGTLDLPETDRSVIRANGQVLELEAGAAEQLRADLEAIRRVVTLAGNVRYDAKRTDEGHADSAWALGLALHALTLPIVGSSRSVELPAV